MKSTKELLRHKRDGQPLTPDEIHRFIDGVVDASVSSAQVGAFCMAACTRGLSIQETSALTLAMARSGTILEPSRSGRPRIDKHSTGGVGDKVSLLLAPLAAACGIDVPMISGRGLGHTGGTLDKLESVPGFTTQLTRDQMQTLLGESGLFMAGQSHDLVPADRIIYAVRDVTGTVENIGLLTASILSKKLAEGLSGLVMDMKVGSAAFMETLDQARALAESMKHVCDAVGMPVRFVFTRMDEPLGYAVGNWLEIAEAEHALATTAERSLAQVTIELVAKMVHLGGICNTLEDARSLVVNVWKNGDAHQMFHRMIAQQGGRWSDAIELYAPAEPVIIRASQNGWIGTVDARDVAVAVLAAGGGRLRESDTIDPLAGVVFHAKRGTEVRTGDEIASVYAQDRQRRDTLATALQGMIQIETAPVEREPSMILEEW